MINVLQLLSLPTKGTKRAQALDSMQEFSCRLLFSILNSIWMVFYTFTVRIQTLLKCKIAGAKLIADGWFVLLSFICPGLGMVSDYCESSLNSIWAIEFLHSGSSTKVPFIGPSVLSLKHMIQKRIQKNAYFSIKSYLIINGRLKKGDCTNMGTTKTVIYISWRAGAVNCAEWDIYL